MREWLALYNTPGIGAGRFRRLIERFSNPANILAMSRECPTLLKEQTRLSDDIIVALNNPDWNLVEQQCAWSAMPRNHLLTWQDAAYPRLLKEIHDPPPVLFAQGELECINQPQLAIVGSRNPSPGGMEIAYQFAYQLSQCGFHITSGLAMGIDGASHRGALAAKGKTIAVLGSGLNCIYPVAHQKLAQQVKENGLLISEFSPQIKANAKHFPMRNRVISGLSLGTLVVEASLKSGSLITARLAAEQGREVFAIPGSIHHSLAKGCHSLIQQGAKLVMTVAEVIEEISGTTANCGLTVNNHLCTVSLDLVTEKLLECVGFEGTSVDQIIDRSGYPIQRVMALLCHLELAGFIRAVPGGYLRVSV